MNDTTKHINFSDHSSLKTCIRKMSTIRKLFKKLYPDEVPRLHVGTSKALFVTGVYRSGTSWIGDILSYAEGIHYWREPFNPSTVNAMTSQYVYLSEGEENYFYEKFVDSMFANRYIGSYFDFTQNSQYFKLSHRHLIKDPTAAFMLDWLHSKYNLSSVVVGRHPFGFVSSIIRLGWDFDLGVFTKQKKLVENYLQPYLSLINEYDKPGLTASKAALIWCVVYFVLEKQSLNKDVTWVLYEDICDSPVESFKSLYSRLGLQWSDHVEKKLISSTKSSVTESNKITTDLSRDTKKMSNIWKDRLSSNEQREIESILSKFDIQLLSLYMM